MSNQHPLNPDAVSAAWESNNGYTEGIRMDDVERMIRAYLAVAQPEVNSANFPNVNRVEVIRDGGRALTVYGTEDVFYDIQDEGRTLKIFMKVPSPDYSAYRKAPYPARNLPEAKP